MKINWVKLKKKARKIECKKSDFLKHGISLEPINFMIKPLYEESNTKYVQ